MYENFIESLLNHPVWRLILDIIAIIGVIVGAIVAIKTLKKGEVTTAGGVKKGFFRYLGLPRSILLFNFILVAVFIYFMSDSFWYTFIALMGILAICFIIIGFDSEIGVSDKFPRNPLVYDLYEHGFRLLCFSLVLLFISGIAVSSSFIVQVEYFYSFYFLLGIFSIICIIKGFDSNDVFWKICGLICGFADFLFYFAINRKWTAFGVSLCIVAFILIIRAIVRKQLKKRSTPKRPSFSPESFVPEPEPLSSSSKNMPSDFTIPSEPEEDIFEDTLETSTTEQAEIFENATPTHMDNTVTRKNYSEISIEEEIKATVKSINNEKRQSTQAKKRQKSKPKGTK